MKKRNCLTAAFGIITGIITLCVCALCYLFVVLVVRPEYPYQDDPLSDPPTGSLQYYNIDPATILTDIKNGKTDIFPIFPEGEPVPNHPSGSFAWSSEDYIAIAKAHHFFLTGEPVGGEWKFFAPGHFKINQCSDNVRGFDSAKIIFYKREAESFPVTYIEINPLRENIRSSYLSYERLPDDTLFEKFWNNPDGSFEESLAVQSPITAEKALQIAEAAGGAALRQQVSNYCRIEVTYYMDDWAVWYRQGGSVLLVFNVDAQDGSYTIDPPWMWK